MKQESLKRLDTLCDEFESALDEGRSMTIESFLARVPEADRVPAFRELLIIELDHLRDAGKRPFKSEYAERFASYVPVVDEVFGPETGLNRGDTSPKGSTDSLTIRRPDRIGDYIILDEIARGGMGVVFRARQENLNREVALKMILSSGLASSRQIQRFIEEGKAIAALQHPHIVQVYDLGEFDGLPFISLELARGGSLADRLRGEPQDPTWSAELIRNIASGVEHAHSRGIIHRDLKPSNILLTEEGVARIADFGLARQQSQSNATKTGEVLGTPNYMSPEQAAGKLKEVGPTADIYSLGAVLFEMLTGRPPFQRETAWATVNAVINEPPSLPGDIVDVIPRELDAIVMKCLEKQTERRYQTAGELTADLERWLAGEPVLATHERRPRYRWRSTLRRRRVWFGAAVAAGLIATIAAIFSSLNSPPLPPSKQLTNSLGMKLILIPAGEFRMGAGQFVPGDPDDQTPQHNVKITRSFYFGAHEVTVQQFRTFVEQTGRQMGPGLAFDNETGLNSKSPTADWTNPGWLQTDNHPVVNVSWADAAAFCEWLSIREGKKYRLPTEAEWEYACRGRTTTVYFPGNEAELLQSYANVADQSFRRVMETFNEKGYYDYTQNWNDGFPFTAPVGQFKPNAFGLYDMHGNVQEWCSDWYEKHYFSRSPIVDPAGPITGETRVKRGGDWLDYVNICRSSFRRSELPTDRRANTIGFRVACDVEAPAREIRLRRRTP